MSQTPNDRHPDIEIYIKQRSVEKIVSWLETLFDTLEQTAHNGKTTRFNARGNGHTIAITVINKATKEFSSVWFDSDQTPWARDLDCARQALSQLDTEIRCIASGWTEGDEPDEWWSVTTEGEQKIQWPS